MVRGGSEDVRAVRGSRSGCIGGWLTELGTMWIRGATSSGTDENSLSWANSSSEEEALGYGGGDREQHVDMGMGVGAVLYAVQQTGKLGE